jgi:uncharacterized membrane protein YtjA (UPF0391 family)
VLEPPPVLLETVERNFRPALLALVQFVETVPCEETRNIPFLRTLMARKLCNARSNAMLGWALTFLVVALIAAVLGFGGIAGFAVEIAKIIFFVAIILFVISAIFGLMRGRSPTVP